MRGMTRVVVVMLLSAVLMNLTACGQRASGQDFVGQWVATASASDMMTITASGTSYVVQDRTGKYAAEYRDGKLHVAGVMGEAVTSYDPATQTISVLSGGKEYTYKRK